MNGILIREITFMNITLKNYTNHKEAAMISEAMIIEAVDCSGSQNLNSPFSNEKGTALVITMFILVLISIMGVFSLSTTSTDLKITGNVRRANEAFYAAERGVEYASGNATIYTTIGENDYCINLTGCTTDMATTDLAESNSDATASVSFLHDGPPPVGSGTDATVFKANYFLIGVTGSGPMSSQKVIDTEIAKIVPKS
jgi:hypothetical protein